MKRFFPLSLFAFASVWTVAAAGADSPRTPFDLARTLEARIAAGDGAMLPDPPWWNHAKRHLGMGDATLYETILFATAAAVFDSGRPTAATNLSQSIPARLRELVFEHEWDQ